ncbi:MAG: zf-HC2 domain-containing protein [Romboutsia sp.]|uniref:zf-HC2 domain-containing protein n=1 Tax=Romboutsia sp. TaxID=1965302 RepID=UPI003F3A8BD7
MSKISCKVIEDLLPLYHDDICSEESKLLIENHILECESCNKNLEAIKADISIIDSEVFEKNKDIEVFKSISEKYRSKKKKSFLFGVGVALVASIILFIGYQGLFCFSVVPISTKELDVSEVSQLLDGRIAYKYKRDYSYPMMKIKISSDSQGNKYVTHYRSILPVGRATNEDTYLYWVFDNEKLEDSDVDVKKVYIGNPKDRQIMWQEGDVLPKASEEAENILHPIE